MSAKAEKIAIVDLDDNIIGYETKDEVHRQGLLHRAFSVYITLGKTMLIQRRHPDKYHSGGLWSNACCSHQRENETLMEAVHRRMEEELGFDCVLDERFDFVYRTQFDSGVTEYELDHVFTGTYSGDIRVSPEEASEIRWVRFDDLKKELETRPQEFSSWFVISAPRVIKLLESGE